MHVGSHLPMIGWHITIHGQHPAVAIGPCIVFIKVSSLLLGDHARASATPLPWPIETAFTVAVGHRDGILLMEYLLITH